MVFRLSIQIHLMLLFILMHSDISGFLSDSNTSHVIVYLDYTIEGNPVETIQIHLMLLFISAVFSRINWYLNSNTSHVIVYHQPVHH